MPEGHVLLRLANEVNATFAGQRVRVSSPQGKFVTAAQLLDGRELLGAESAGKQLFINFGRGDLIHIHLGLIGRLDFHPLADPIGQVRLRIDNGVTSADLRGATTCRLIAESERDEILSRLGPDPLRADSVPDLAWARIRTSKRPIGELLMDQSEVSGVGNVYRSEVLFRQRIHPLRPGNLLKRQQFKAVWDDLVGLMQEGVRLGRIDTVLPEHTPEAMGRQPRVDDHGGEVYVYRRAGQECFRCGSTVKTENLAGRNSFWCPNCQRKRASWQG